MDACSSVHPDRVCRVERFKVPDAALSGFFEAISKSHEILRTLPGFVKDCVLEQTGGRGDTHIVTVAVWENSRAVETATALLAKRYHKIGYDPGETLRRLGMDAERGHYVEAGNR